MTGYSHLIKRCTPAPCKRLTRYDCATCQELPEIEDNLQKLPEASRQFFSDLADTLMHARTELGRAECVIDGSWPGAEEEIAEARRARADRERAIPDNVILLRLSPRG